MDHREIKSRLLQDRETRRAYEHPPLRLAIAKAVLQRRQELRISQKELALALGTSQMQVWRLETAQGNPTLETLEKLQNALGIELGVHLVERELQPA